MREMTKAIVREIADEAIVMLEELADKRGISVTYGGGNYSKSNAVLKFEFAILNEGGVAQTRTVEDWATFAPRYGLPVDGIGKMFQTGNGYFRIVGWKHGNSKYPVICEKVADGKQYKMTPMQVKAGLKMMEE